MRRTRNPGLVLIVCGLLSSPSARAGAADGVQKLLDLGRAEAAQARCERSGGTLSSAEPELRELCARAFWDRAVQVDTVSEWLRFQQTWAGTSLAKEAREQEARAALRDLGTDAPEHRYRSWMAQYGDTQLSARGASIMGKAAIARALKAPDTAADVAARYPDHPDVVKLVQAFPERFAKVEVDGEALSVRMEPEVPLPSPPRAVWAVRFGGEVVVEWEQAVITHLEATGLPRKAVEALGRDTEPPFPPCPVAGAEWELGVQLQLGEVRSFLPHLGSESCPPWPTFVVLRGDGLVAVSPGPGLVLPLANPAGEVLERPDARIPLLGAAGPPLIVDDGLAQPVGRLQLVTPLAPALPYYLPRPLPAGPTALTADALGTVGLPDGWRVVAGDAELQPGSVAADGAHVVGPGLSAIPWELPPGEVRVLSPVLASVLGLHRGGPAFLDDVVALPPLGVGQAPVGSVPLALGAVPRHELAELGTRLTALGVGVRLERAHKVLLRGQVPQVAWEGTLGEVPVRGLLDPIPGGGWKIWLWEADPGSGAEPEVSSFQWQERTWLVWRRPDGVSEALHFGPGGLRRQTGGR